MQYIKYLIILFSLQNLNIKKKSPKNTHVDLILRLTELNVIC